MRDTSIRCSITRLYWRLICCFSSSLPACLHSPTPLQFILSSCKLRGLQEILTCLFLLSLPTHHAEGMQASMALAESRRDLGLHSMASICWSVSLTHSSAVILNIFTETYFCSQHARCYSLFSLYPVRLRYVLWFSYWSSYNFLCIA